MYQRQPLAVVGYAYRAPDVGRKGLFEFLEQGKSAWSRVPADRFNHNAYYHPDSERPGFISSHGGHFLPEDLYAFDPAFFNIKAEEARSMDPQHRLLLECAFEAAESAGLLLDDLMGANVGVFAASDKSEYYNTTAQDLSTASIFTATGVNPCMFANRLSYFFGLTGPSVAVDAACASSCSAIHQACQAILAGECSAAFVGGAKTLNGPNQWIELDTMGTLSSEGKCFSYDSRASGFGRGEGAACMIIKPLSDALACGDPVRAIIKNSASNHSGRTQGISMPGRASQEKLLSRLHQEIGLDPNDTAFVEGHGTGTQVGDPVEAGAISTVIASKKSSSNPLYIGSVKSNIGHLENASGLLSVIKCIMMLEHEVMLPNANFEIFNPGIDGRDRLKVLTESMPWPSNAAKRVCVSNFGFGGSNAALLLEAAPKLAHLNEDGIREQTNAINHINGNHHTNDNHRTNDNHQNNGNGAIEFIEYTKNKIGLNGNYPKFPARGFGGPLNGHSDTENTERLFLFSARSQVSLDAYMASFRDYLNTASPSIEKFNDIAFTLGHRRTNFHHRTAIRASSIDELKQNLQTFPSSTKSVMTKDQTFVFVFTGQGAQYFQMGNCLRRYNQFRETISAAEQILKQLGATWSLTDELNKGEHESRIDDAEISQPACTAIQIALINLLKSWHITPTAVIGHSSGEIAAAYAARILTFETALAIAFYRGIAASKILKDTTVVQGAMLAIGTSAEEAEKLFPNDNSYAVIAAVNSYSSVTISGDLDAVEYIQEQAQERGLFVRRLKTGLAYHSRHMERVATAYSASIESFCCLAADVISGVSRKPVFVSSVTGRIEPSAVIDAKYWVQNLLQPVQYLKAVETLFSNNKDSEGLDVAPNILIEIGPHSALQNSSRDILARLAMNGTTGSPSLVTYMPSLVRGKKATTALLDLAANLYSRGVSINIGEVNQTEPSHARVVHDLPPYEWNKAVRYIHQPRVGKQKLFGGKAYDVLLGWESPYQEGDEHAYRNVISLEDLPWIRDHVVDGKILFPFTGFVSLAIKAFRSLNDNVSGVILRELHVSTSLEIDENKPADITTKFRPTATGTASFTTSVWNFEILSWTEAHGWKRHSHGLIEADNSRDPFSTSPTVQAALRGLENQELEPLDVSSQYALLRESNGIAYGKTFRNTLDFRQASKLVVHTIALRDIELEAYGSSSKSPFTVDPPTLDSIFHSLGAIQEISGPRPILVPSYCSQWRLANEIPATTGQRFTIVSRRLAFDEKASSMQMDFVVFDTSGLSPKPVAEIGPLTLQCISRQEATNLHFPDSFAFQDVPYINLMDADVISRALEGTPPPESQISHRHDLDQAAMVFLSRALEAEYDLSDLPPHFPSFLAWAKKALADNQLSITEADIQVLVDRVSTSNATGELVCAIGGQLPSILRGEKQPLEIMLEDGLLWRTYAENVAGIRANQALAGYVELLSANNAELNILELGAGTASATLPILEGISRATKGAATCFSYTFTDISAGFFDKAQVKLSQWSEHMFYKKLDISHDPVSQGFQAEVYDVVLASNVLHATSDIVSTLNNVRSLLKPGGKLLLMEGVSHPPPSFLPYALLPGWWLFEDSYRTDGPLLTKESWNSALLANGFSGLEGYVDDYPKQPEQLFSALWSSRCDQEEEAQTHSPVTIYRCIPDQESRTFSATLSSSLENHFGRKPTVKGFSDFNYEDKDELCIIMDGKQCSIFSSMTSETFYTLKNLFLKSSRLIWFLPHKAHPDASMIRGLLRTIRLELPTSKLILFEAPLNEEAAQSIGKLGDHIMRDQNSLVQSEQEYSLINGTICVPRLQLLEAAKETFAMEAGNLIKSEQKLRQENTAFEVSVDFAGSLDSLYFRRSDILENNLGDEEIIVRVEAAGINFIDLVTVLGTLPWSPPGLEGAGIIERIGSNVNDLQVGDRVFYAVSKAGLANVVRMPGACAYKLPDNLDFVEAASLPIAYSTAIMSLLDVGRLQKGESVLIHSASGAVGQACISIAQSLGARIFATAGTQEKREFLTSKFSIPSNQIFSSRTSEFKDGVLGATDNHGVDVVINCLSGQLLQYTWELIAENGRFIEIGKKDFIDNSYLPMGNFMKNVTFSGVDVRRIIITNPAKVNRWLSTIIHMFQEEKIAPIHPITTIAASEVKNGLRKLQAGKNMGKIVVNMGPNDCVLAESRSPMRRDGPTSTLLQADATYVIAGGTGGIGRALVPWMIGKGAKNVVILGRSALTNPKVQEILKRYENTNVCVRAIHCDVGSRIDMIRASQAIMDLPRVRGVVHSAIRLSDAIFANLKYSDYQETTGSRVQGAWLLHELYPNLEFFVALSGMTGIVGNSGQSIYTGTSTFLEAFVDYRLALGLPGAVIHLPPVEDIGRVAELNIGERLKSSIGGILSAEEVYTLMEGAIIGPSAGLDVGGRNLSWNLVSSTEVETLPWEGFMPTSVMTRRRRSRDGSNHSKNGKENQIESHKSGSLDGLMDALIDKVSAMTAMDKDEVTPTRSLIDYGLDSLISLELRNWIRRNFHVHMETNEINTSTDLKAIADYIVSQRKAV